MKRGITSKEQIGMKRENFLSKPFQSRTSDKHLLQSRTSEIVADVLKNKPKATTTKTFPIWF